MVKHFEVKEEFVSSVICIMQLTQQVPEVQGWMYVCRSHLVSWISNLWLGKMVLFLSCF